MIRMKDKLEKIIGIVANIIADVVIFLFAIFLVTRLIKALGS